MVKHNNGKTATAPSVMLCALDMRLQLFSLCPIYCLLLYPYFLVSFFLSYSETALPQALATPCEDMVPATYPEKNPASTTPGEGLCHCTPSRSGSIETIRSVSDPESTRSSLLFIVACESKLRMLYFSTIRSQSWVVVSLWMS